MPFISINTLRSLHSCCTIIPIVCAILHPLQVKANNHEEELKAVKRLCDSFSNCSAELHVTRKNVPVDHWEASRRIYLYVTPHKMAYSSQFNITKDRREVTIIDQGRWEGQGGAYMRTIEKSKTGKTIRDDITLWDESISKSFIRRSTLQIEGVFDWPRLPKPLGDYLIEHASTIRSSTMGDRTIIELSTEWGQIKVELNKSQGNIIVHSIEIIKTPESIYCQDEPGTLRVLAPDVKLSKLHYEFEYEGIQPRKIFYHTLGVITVDNKDDENRYALDIEFVRLFFGTDQSPPPDLVAPHLVPIKNGQRVHTVNEALQPIALEWRDGKVVKAIDQTALNVAEEMSKFQASERAKARERWKWIGLASFGGLVLVLTAVWWWRASRKSMT